MSYTDSNTYAQLQRENETLRRELTRYQTIVEQLQQSQSRLQFIIESLPGAVFWKDTSSIYQGCNATFARFAGLASPAEVVGKSDFDMPWKDTEAHAYRAHDQQVMTRGIAEYHISETQLRADGSKVWVDTNKIPLRNAQGEIIGLLGIYEDVTAQKQTEVALRDSQQLLQTLFDHLPVATFVKSAAEGRFTLWNKASEELFGLQEAEVIGKTDYDFFPREQADFFRQKDHEVFAGNTPQVIPSEPVDSQHQGRRILRTIKVPIFDADNVPQLLLVISVDITEQQQLAEERASLQVQVIEAQQAALRELSTPLIPLSQHVVLLPLVGIIDSNRAQQVIETLLTGVTDHCAQLAILDITGVQVVDTQVADALIRAARAVKLLGARVMLTGIRPEIAQTLVQLGVRLDDIQTRGSLQVAVAEALQGGRVVSAFPARR